MSACTCIQGRDSDKSGSDLDAASAVNLHEAKGGGLLLVSGQGSHSDVGPCGAVSVDEVLVIHSVQVVTCKRRIGAIECVTAYAVFSVRRAWPQDLEKCLGC